jgi:hypothetical protein
LTLTASAPGVPVSTANGGAMVCTACSTIESLVLSTAMLRPRIRLRSCASRPLKHDALHCVPSFDVAVVASLAQVSLAPKVRPSAGRVVTELAALAGPKRSVILFVPALAPPANPLARERIGENGQISDFQSSTVT